MKKTGSTHLAGKANPDTPGDILSLAAALGRGPSSLATASSPSISLIYELISFCPSRTLLILEGDPIFSFPLRCEFSGRSIKILNWALIPVDSGPTVLALLLEGDARTLEGRLKIEVVPHLAPLPFEPGAVSRSASLTISILSMLLIDSASDEPNSLNRWTATAALAKRLGIDALATFELEGSLISTKHLDMRFRTLIGELAFPQAFYLSLQGVEAIAIPVDMKVSRPDRNRQRLCEIQARIKTDSATLSLSSRQITRLVMFSGGSLTNIRLS